MLDLKNMYITNAHRLSQYEVDESVTEIREGQFFQLNADSKWVYADGTKKAYLTLNNRFAGAGLGMQKERLEGRDDVSRIGKISCLMGAYEVGTLEYDKDAAYEVGDALVISTTATKKGLVTSAGATAPTPNLIVGYVTQLPEGDDDFLRFASH